ncbi:hypothetical protein EV182_001776 [Spiromyces aspiralis]|uniref:Uncharacterized protein n=1 Tax=Spiromyces aspiralis TaxID=68401 RepID=A0ACC1HW62_9FUNG|nr:hypothetical protein EV182_001776 [Spiromyces aspiralis]
MYRSLLSRFPNMSRYAAERVRIVENEVPLFATLDKAIGKFNNARRAHGQIQNQRLEGNSRQSWFLVDRHLLDAAKTRLHAHEEYVELLIKAGQLINARAAAERIIQLRGSLRVCRFVGEDQAPCDDYVQGNTQGLIDNLEQLVYIEDNLGNDGRATLLRQRVAKLTNELPTTAA